MRAGLLMFALLAPLAWPAPRIATAAPPVMPHFPKRVPLDEAALRDLTAAIQRAGFRDEKLAVLELATRTRWFLCAQVIALMRLYQWSEDRVRAVELMAPWILDRDNRASIWQAAPSADERDRLRQILQR